MHCKATVSLWYETMKLDEALEQLDAISAVADRATTFEGLRSFPTATTAVVGLLAAFFQTQVIGSNPVDVPAFLALWVGVAGISLCVVMTDMVYRYHCDPTARSRRMTLEVLYRLLPSIVVGGALTAVVYFSAREVAWMLPGLWSILLGMGIFAASSLLPPLLQKAGIWYVGCGLAVLILAQDAYALHPLSMAIPFGLGQIIGACLIHSHSKSRDALRSQGQEQQHDG